MSLTIEIKPEDFVSDIVNRHYSTADVFRKYGIDYCCSAKWPIEDTCFAKNLDAGSVVNDLNLSVNAGPLSLLQCSNWSIDFQLDYIINVYHAYINQALPDIQRLTQEFTNKHQKNFCELQALNDQVAELVAIAGKWIPFKENIVFPYLRSMAHAHQSKESYGGLMVRTLQKPVNSIIPRQREKLISILLQMATITKNYSVPNAACTSHKVTFYKLQQLAQNLQQQLYLEYAVLYPRALAIEKELLAPALNSK